MRVKIRFYTFHLLDTCSLCSISSCDSEVSSVAATPILLTPTVPGIEGEEGEEKYWSRFDPPTLNIAPPRDISDSTASSYSSPLQNKINIIILHDSFMLPLFSGFCLKADLWQMIRCYGTICCMLGHIYNLHTYYLHTQKRS